MSEIKRITLEGTVNEVSKLSQKWHDRYIKHRGTGIIEDFGFADRDYFKVSVKYINPFDGCEFNVEKFPFTDQGVLNIKSKTPNFQEDFFSFKGGIYSMASRLGTNKEGKFQVKLVGVSNNCRGDYISTKLSEPKIIKP